MPDATAATAAIELRDATAVSGEYEVFKRLSVAFPESATTVILGSTGSGKSSLIKMAAGLLPPAEGVVLFRGQDMGRFGRKEELAFRAASGFVFQDAALWANTSIQDNVAIPLRVHQPKLNQAELAEKVRATLSRLGWTEGLALRPVDLSSGEQKLVSIARALVHDPSLVFMDDPGSSLDEDSMDKLYEVLSELKSRGKTVIMTTNNSELAYRYADCLGVLKSGALLAFGRYEETVAKAESELDVTLARLRARGDRVGPKPSAGQAEAGSEMSQRSDV